MSADLELDGTLIWSQRRKNWCRTPFTFTVYGLSSEELGVRSGVLSQDFNTVKLFRIVDVTLTRSLTQRLFGLSTLTINANDASSHGVIRIDNIIDGFSVRKKLQAAVDASRSRYHVTSREFMDDADDNGYGY
jgi:uncharacterized membrane protein YdbT with pleckstrin-like domain